MTGFGPLLPAAGCPVIAITGFPKERIVYVSEIEGLLSARERTVSTAE